MIKLRLINDQSISSLQSDLRNYNFDDININPNPGETIKDFMDALYQTYHNCRLIKTKTLSQKKEQ